MKSEFVKKTIMCMMICSAAMLQGEVKLLFTEPQLRQIRERVKNDECAAKWWETFQSKVDKRLKPAVEVPSCGGKWYHLYSCSKCGAALKMKSLKEHVCKSCGILHTGEPYDGAAYFFVHHKYATDVREFGIAYAISGKTEYVKKAEEILLGYAEKYKTYPLVNKNGEAKKGGAHVMSQALDEAVWLINMVHGYDCIRDAIDAANQKKIEEGLIIPSAAFLKTENHGIHNHECWHLASWGLAGLLLGRKDWVDDAINGKTGFIQQIEQGVTADGPWFEGAWGYHFYTLMALEPMAIALNNCGMLPDLPKYKAMYLAPLEALTPEETLPAFHDSVNIRLFDNQNLQRYELAAKLWPHEKLFRMALARSKDRVGELNVLFGNSAAYGTEDGDFKYENKLWDDLGVAIMRAQSANMKPDKIPCNYLALDYGRYGGWHGHPDKLNLVLWGRGRLLSEDPGCIAYGNPCYTGWYKATISHNTVMLDGKNQKEKLGGRLGTGLEGKVLNFGESNGFCVGSFDGGPVYDGAVLERHVAMCGDVVFDMFSVRCEKERDIMWLFHSRDENGKGSSGKPIETPRFSGAEWATDWKMREHDGNVSVRWVEKNGVALELTQASDAGKLYSSVGRGGPPPNKFTLYGNSVKGKEALFASVFVISHESESAPKVQVLDRHLESDGTCWMKASVGGKVFLFVYTPRDSYEVHGVRFNTKSGVVEVLGNLTKGDSH